ncbi:hypothetical protein [Agrobacterium vitis]|uniref:hypothetical protein n=1 Tax=Agrobacterium vitis TaxID=373 RepID=UPI0008FB97C0|nr:hypothetical protein [Agrobacterium vitis]OHZ35498.1 hypothetical protein BBL07_19240 [Agrobacterium vitis]
MNFRIMLTAGLALALAGCTTTSGVMPVQKKNLVEERWVGQPAGAFFAKVGPPINDEQAGGATVYSWRGGFRTRTVAPTYAQTPDGKRGKVTKAGRTEYLRCEVRVTVSPDYVIRAIKPVIDRPVESGKTWCEEFLGGA